MPQIILTQIVAIVKNNASYNVSGHIEWLNLFGGEVINSPFQDGHYIYRVVPGYGSGESAVPPILYVILRIQQIFIK